MTTVVDYQHTVPSAYQFPGSKPLSAYHPSPVFTQPSPIMVKPHPQPLNLQTPMARASPYLQPSIPGRQGAYPGPAHFRSSSTSTAVSGASLQRSTSNASSGSSNTYVTALRKQKATVWCDRAQREDARLLAAQKAAKARAALEIAKAAAQASSHGSNGNGPSSVHRGKIRHHGSGGKKSSTMDHEFSTNRSLVAGVPARLDIEDGSDDEEHAGSASGSAYGGITRRTNSGRSSINSTGRRYGTPQLQLQVANASLAGAHTNTSSPSTYSRTSSLLETSVAEVPEIVETPGTVVPDMRTPGRQEYFTGHTKQHYARPVNATHPVGTVAIPQPSDSYSSSSSGESRPQMPRSHSSREPGDIRRKGSIDESRTMTMGRVRLFVANPDQ